MNRRAATMWQTRLRTATASASCHGRLLASSRSFTVRTATALEITTIPTTGRVHASSWNVHETQRACVAKVVHDGNHSSNSAWRWAAAAAAAGSALAWSLPDGRDSPKLARCSAGQAEPIVVAQGGSGGDVVAAAAVSQPSSAQTVDPSVARKTTITSGEADSGAMPQQHRAIALSLASEYNANGPIEDRYDVRESPRGDFFASVYDGHGGWQCAEFARKRLNIAAQSELNNSLAKSPEQVKGAITHAFLRVEREYLYQVKAAFELGFGSVAKTGSCALMTLVRDQILFVANAGDCRAVLGRRRKSSLGAWGGGGGEGVVEAVALSNDHNAREKTEQEKLKRLHPCEEDIVKCKRANACYVKGRLQPTRSLGDAYLKYSEFNGQAGSHSSAGRFLPPPYTPPYITAEPEIYVHNIDPAQDEFVVLASDGLWDFVSSAEAVDIVQTAAYQDGNPSSAGDRLIQVVLERAAARYNLTVEGLKGVREGPSRRSKHDDITCVVFFLEGNEKNAGFSASGANVAKGNTTSTSTSPPPSQ